jgi:hypothetical protein
MPSRPRPLARGRRLFASPEFYPRRRRPRRARPDRWPPIADDPAVLAHGFDGAPSALPLATLRASAAQARYRMLVGDLQRWLIDRLIWLRPRTIPILVACAALPAILALFEFIKFPEGRFPDGTCRESRDRGDARLLRAAPPVHRPRHLAVTAPDAEHLWRLQLTQPSPAPKPEVDYIEVTLVEPDPR